MPQKRNKKILFILFTDIESSVRDIVNITAVAVIDAIVEKKKANK